MKNKNNIIYKIRNLLNGKVYIGQSVNITARLNDHKKLCRRRKNHHLYNSFNKYGIENFEFIVLEWITDKNKLSEAEQFWMDFYTSYNPEYGYNLRPKAESNRGHKHTEETKRNMALNNTKYMLGKQHTKETRLKIGLGNKGKAVSEKTREKISLVLKGTTLSEEHKLNISLGKLGKKRKPFTDDTKKKMADSHKGKKITDEHRKNMSISRNVYLAKRKAKIIKNEKCTV